MRSNYRDQAGTPHWAEYVIVNLFHSLALEAARRTSYGNDYIAGGAGTT